MSVPTDSAAKNAPESQPTTRKQRALQTRERVLKTAMLEFAQRSYEEVQVSEIAAKAEVAHGIIFHYFSNKQGLYIESIKAIIQILFNVPDPDPTLKPYYRIRAHQASLFMRMVSNKELFLGYVRHAMSLEASPDTGVILSDIGKRIERKICEICEIEGDVELAINMLHSFHTAHDQLVANWITDGQPYPMEALIEASIQMLIGALRTAHAIDNTLDIERGIQILSNIPD